MDGELHTLSEIADRLRLPGRDRQRAVLRRFARFGIPIVNGGRGARLVTDQQFKQLIEAMTCLPCEDAASASTSAARSASVVKPVSSKNILRGVIAEKARKPIARASRRKSGTKCFTVLEGGRSA